MNILFCKNLPDSLSQNVIFLTIPKAVFRYFHTVKDHQSPSGINLLKD
jgi:hypothetical protein